MTPLDPARERLYRRLAGGYAADPVGYMRAVLGTPFVAPGAAAVARSLVRPPYRTLVRAANNVGKTHLLGQLVNWAHDSHDPGVVLATGASYRQVRTQMFKEVRSARPFGLNLLPRAPVVYHHAAHQVIGFSTNKADAFQGFHDAALTLVMDEASGVHQDFWDRGETMFQPAPGHAWLSTYNPNDPGCPAYAAEQSGGWHVETLSALDHPNVLAELRGDPPPVPGAVRLAKVWERVRGQCEPLGSSPADGSFEFPPGSGRHWLPTDPRFDPQVRGLWPARSADQVWGLSDWDRCLGPVEVDPTWPVQVGCDAARRGGDRTAFAVRRGVALVHLEATNQWPTERAGLHAADRLRELCREHAPPGVAPEDVPCLIDSTGGYGTPITDYAGGWNFAGVNASSKAASPHYPNARSELWWQARVAAGEGALRAGTCTRVGHHLLDELRQELCAARYSLDHRGRRVVDGKAEIARRLGRSPDLADAVNLAWYMPGR